MTYIAQKIERQTETRPETDRGKETDRKTGRDRKIERQTGKQADRETESTRERQRKWQTDNLTDTNRAEQEQQNHRRRNAPGPVYREVTTHLLLLLG